MAAEANEDSKDKKHKWLPEEETDFFQIYEDGGLRSTGDKTQIQALLQKHPDTLTSKIIENKITSLRRKKQTKRRQSEALATNLKEAAWKRMALAGEGSKSIQENARAIGEVLGNPETRKECAEILEQDLEAATSQDRLKRTKRDIWNSWKSIRKKAQERGLECLMVVFDPNPDEGGQTEAEIEMTSKALANVQAEGLKKQFEGLFNKLSTSLQKKRERGGVPEGMNQSRQVLRPIYKTILEEKVMELGKEAEKEGVNVPRSIFKHLKGAKGCVGTPLIQALNTPDNVQVDCVSLVSIDVMRKLCSAPHNWHFQMILGHPQDPHLPQRITLREMGQGLQKMDKSDPKLQLSVHQKTCEGPKQKNLDVSWPVVDLTQEEAPVSVPQDWNDAEIADCSQIQSGVTPTEDWAEAECAVSTQPVPAPNRQQLFRKNFKGKEAIVSFENVEEPRADLMPTKFLSDVTKCGWCKAAFKS